MSDRYRRREPSTSERGSVTDAEIVLLEIERIRARRCRRHKDFSSGGGAPFPSSITSASAASTRTLGSSSPASCRRGWSACSIPGKTGPRRPRCQAARLRTKASSLPNSSGRLAAQVVTGGLACNPCGRGHHERMNLLPSLRAEPSRPTIKSWFSIFPGRMRICLHRQKPHPPRSFRNDRSQSNRVV